MTQIVTAICAGLLLAGIAVVITATAVCLVFEVIRVVRGGPRR